MAHDGHMATISKRHEVDPVFAGVVDVLFEGAVDVREAYDISKMNDSSEMHVQGALTKIKVCPQCKKAKCTCKVSKREMSDAQRQKRQAQIGLASNIVGITAGTAATGAAVLNAKKAVKNPTAENAGPVMGKVVSSSGKIGRLARGRTGKLVVLGALGGAGLQVGNVAGDIVSNRVLSREAKKKVSKALEDIVRARRDGVISNETAIELAATMTESIEKGLLNNARLMAGAAKTAGKYQAGAKARKTAGTLTALKDKQPHFTRVAAGMAGGTGVAVGFAGAKKIGKPPAVSGEVTQPPAPPKPPKIEGVRKADEVEYVFAGEISKRDEDKRLAFGWCNLSTVGGEPVVDLQGDYAPIEEIEKSAYKYVVESRKGGDMHQRVGDGPLHTADLVESFVVTPEKLAELGVPTEVAKGMNTGWWVGFKVNDDEQWAKVKSGERAGFSVHGSGKRVEKSL